MTLDWPWTKPHIYRRDGWWFCMIGGHIMGASLANLGEAYATAVRIWFRLRHG